MRNIKYGGGQNKLDSAKIAESKIFADSALDSANYRKIAKSSEVKLFYRLVVLHNDISPYDQRLLQENITKFSDFSSLEFISMDDRFVREWEALGLRAHFAKEFFYKLLLTSYFKCDKVIVSDVDVVFLGDVSEGFLTFEGDEYIAGVKANNPNAIFPLDGWKKGYQDFSARDFDAVKNGVGGGYLIANLKAWRRDNIEAKLIKYLYENATKLVLAEQDVLNIICYPHIATLSPAHIVCHENWERFGECWEKLVPEFYTQDELNNARNYPIQLHFVGDKKPWKIPSVPKSEIWYEYISKTTFARRFFKDLENNIIDAHKKRQFWSRLKGKILRIWCKFSQNLQSFY